jgi:tetratricopeptide (TPR) repeat protein
MVSAALLALLLAAPAKDPISWIDDDYAKAKARAAKENKLVAVDVWAPWCHSCLSMKNFTMKEKPLGRVASKLVWIALDYDKPENAPFFARVPINAWPTYLVIDPKDDSVVARWLGTGTAEDMAGFFEKAKRGSSDPLSDAHRAIERRAYADAIAILEPALKEPKLDPDRRTRLLNAWVEALWKSDPAKCAELGVAHLDEVVDSDQGLDTVSTVGGCAAKADPAKKQSILLKVKERLEKAAAGPAFDKLSVDDRSGVYDTLIETYDELKEDARAKETVERRLSMLDAAAKSAKSPAERATFDAHRLDCAMRLGRFKEAEEMLTRSAADFPKDYNPPARLALLYLKQGRIDEGLVAVDRGLALVYGPRALRLYSTKVDLLVAKKDYAGAKRTIEEGRAAMLKLDPAVGGPDLVKRLDDKLIDIKKREEGAQAAR